ncbi:MAG TPA: hypothetical protein VNO14_01610 [Blastocatellia bacterium]|nr:hypothetical protein [Blastocatellia bacterium]
MKKLLLSLLILLAAGSPAGAQSPDKELRGKALTLMEEVLRDLRSLRSAGNRAHLLTRSAEALWKHDEKRARLLFKEAASEIGGMIAELRYDDAWFQQKRQSLYNLRSQAIQIAQRLDPWLALDFLNATRQTWGGLQHYGGQQDPETSLRWMVAKQALEKHPQLSLEIAEESLESGFSYEIDDLTQRLYRRDKQAGERLAAAVIRKLRGLDLVSNPMAAHVAASLLRAAVEGMRSAERQRQIEAGGNETPFRLSERETAGLMEMVVKAAISEDGYLHQPRSGYSQHLLNTLHDMTPEIERYCPIEARSLRGKLEENRKALANPPGVRPMQENLASARSIDEYLKAIEDAPQEMRSNLYQQAAMRAMGEGDPERARQIINDRISDPGLREDLLLNIERQLIWKAQNEGKVEEARRIAASLNQKEEQATILARLALTASGNGDKKTALQLIDEARSLLGAAVESYSQMHSHLQIAIASISLDPGKSFEIIEHSIDRFNQNIAAARILEGFEIHQYFSEGELALWAEHQLTSTLNQYLDQLGALARSDFDRAKSAADRFERLETQIMARLHVARRALSDHEAESGTGFGNSGTGVRGIIIR